MLAAEIRDGHASRVLGEAPHVAEVTGGYHGSAGQIRDRDDECVDDEFGAGPDAPEQLSGSHADAGVNRMHLDALPPHASEDRGVRSTATYHLGKDYRDNADGQISPAHLDHEGSNPVAPASRSVRDRRHSLAIQKEHQPARRVAPPGCVRSDSQRSTSRAAQSNVSGGTGP